MIVKKLVNDPRLQTRGQKFATAKLINLPDMSLIFGYLFTPYLHSLAYFGLMLRLVSTAMSQKIIKNIAPLKKTLYLCAANPPVAM